MRPLFRSFMVLAVLLAGAPARAEIYKYYDAEGNLVLSDTVPKDNPELAEKLKPRPIMTIPAMAPDRRRMPVPVATKAKASAAEEYVIVIQSPANDETYPRGSGPVALGVSVSPGLAAGHRLEFLLDGQPAADLARIEPDQMDRGSHVLTARVVDSAGTVLKVAEVTFHVQQRSALSQPAGRPKPAAGRP